MNLATLFKDPPPAYAFEVSEAGIASADVAKAPLTEFHPLTPGTVSVSPLRDNILMPDELAAAVRRLAPVNGARKRRDIALILPDYCARVAVLDFDSFPADAKEQISLVRFRMKKSVPFDVESAAVGYWTQTSGGKVDVVAAVAPVEIIARYEAPFRAAGMNPGFVTTSSLAVLQLVDGRKVTVIAKLSGNVLTLMVVNGGVLKLIRCLELGEVAADLYPTVAYVEDQLGVKAEGLLLCGFGAGTDEYQRQFHKDLGIPVEPLRSPMGVPGETNAGLLGFLTKIQHPPSNIRS
jgi:type IV pilus assembly protein PilM